MTLALYMCCCLKKMSKEAWILHSFGQVGHHVLFVCCCYNNLQNATQYTIEHSNKIVCNKNLHTTEDVVVVVPFSHHYAQILPKIQVSNERGHMSNIHFPEETCDKRKRKQKWKGWGTTSAKK